MTPPPPPETASVSAVASAPVPPRYRGIWIAAVAAALARIVFGLALAPLEPRDPDNYLPLARSLADGEGLVWNGTPTAYRPPLYPLTLAAGLRVFDAWTPRRIVVYHALLGGAAAALTGWAAARWGLSPRRAAVAAALAGFDPVLLAQSPHVMTENLAATLVAASFVALARADGAASGFRAGVLLGLTALCRPGLLPAGLLIVAARAFAPSPVPRGARGIAAAAAAFGIVATLAPWAIRNRIQLGEFVWTTTHGGYTLLLANNPVYYDDVLNGPPGAVWSGPNQAKWFESLRPGPGPRSEPAGDRRLRDEAVAFALSRPRDFARAALARLGRLWGVAPTSGAHPAPVRIATAVWTVPLWIALAAGLAARPTRSWPRIAAPAALIGLTIVHIFYWTDMRMRAPMVPAVALLAAAAPLARPARRSGERPDGPVS